MGRRLELKYIKTNPKINMKISELVIGLSKKNLLKE